VLVGLQELCEFHLGLDSNRTAAMRMCAHRICRFEGGERFVLRVTPARCTAAAGRAGGRVDRHRVELEKK